MSSAKVATSPDNLQSIKYLINIHKKKTLDAESKHR